ncbi:hypothetical protein D6_0212 [Aeromonas phage D6]|uniref:Uncharacterized protein n=1 Tax=Aeromonas phage D6 TaxID=2593322 RepID=A0A514TWG8_9CAUD|nr:hypothetical protein PQC08_gp063 [Aeromonas phage D6]QDJ97371.1 hypothetical protein D6_0212 [Aeromonas phage D6]
MINEQMLAGAIRKAIEPLTSIEDNNLFMFEVGQVLCRFKTNVYMMLDEDMCCRDPNELINFVITAGADVVNAGGYTEIIKRDRTVLRISGVHDYGATTLEQGHEFLYNEDISDLIPADRLVRMHDTHFMSARQEGEGAPKNDLERFESLGFNLESAHGYHFNTDRFLDSRATVSMTISGRVFAAAYAKKRRETAERHPGSEGRYLSQGREANRLQRLEDESNPVPEERPGLSGRQFHMQFMAK